MSPESVKTSHSLSRLKNLWGSQVSRLLIVLALGKAAILFSLYLFDQSPTAIQTLATRWDSAWYETIAVWGYGHFYSQFFSVLASYVFSPVYPLSIRFGYYFVGSAWVSALIVTNSLSFVFPIVVYKTFGYRTALFAELFPTYLVFTTIAYSDVIALVFLASALLLILREKIMTSSIAASMSILTFYNLAWTLPSYAAALLRGGRRRNLLFYAVPLAAGVLILLWFKVETGDYLAYFALGAPWGHGFTNPIVQAQYLLCLGGQESFTCPPFDRFGIVLPPPYWLVRNVIFEAFYLFGAFYLLRTDNKYRFFLFAYCLSVIVPLLFLTGFPSLVIPRLLLPAFPVFIAYSSLLKKGRSDGIYFLSCIVIAATILLLQYFAFFA